MSDKKKFELARVYWRFGQPLLPEHLFLQEKSLLSNTTEHYRALESPYHGVVELNYDEAQLRSGVLSINNLSLILSSGLLIKSGSNMFFSPDNLKLDGEKKCSIYCHILQKDLKNDESWCSEEDKRKVEKIFYRAFFFPEKNLMKNNLRMPKIT